MFANGFGAFLSAPHFSDVLLVTPEGQQYEAHKLLLSYSSQYFNKLLHSPSANNTASTLLLEGPFTKDIPLLLDFLYNGHITFTNDNAMLLLALADYYLVKELKQAASDYIIGTITRDNALTTLKEAIRFNAEEMISKCLQVVTKNFSPIVESGSSFSFLPVELLVRLIRRDNLAVSSEVVVYQVVCQYVDSHLELNEEEINLLFGAVRFPFLTIGMHHTILLPMFCWPDQLKEAESNPKVPKPYLTEALLERLKKHEKEQLEPNDKDRIGGEDSTNRYIHFFFFLVAFSENKRRRPRHAYAISLEYEYDFDTRGVFYYVGTKGWAESWTNPAARYEYDTQHL